MEMLSVVLLLSATLVLADARHAGHAGHAGNAGHAEHAGHGNRGSPWGHGWRERPDRRHREEWRDVNDWRISREDHDDFNRRTDVLPWKVEVLSEEEDHRLYEWIPEEERRPIYPDRRHIRKVEIDDEEDLWSPPGKPVRLPQEPSDPVNPTNTQKFILPPLSETKRIPPQWPEYDQKPNSQIKPGIDWITKEKPVLRPDWSQDKKEINHGKRIMENLLSNLPTDLSTELCPRGWHNHGPKCYIYVPFKTTWPDAERNCLILGGNLASVHGLQQYKFLLNVIEKGEKRDQRTWIGANDAVQEGLWLWSDGTRFKYHKWSQGQPSNYKIQEHCMEMNYGADRGQNDVPCWYEFPFVCSRKL